MAKINLKFDDVRQYWGMGGPFLADLYIDDKKLRGRFLLNHSVCSDSGRYILFSHFEGYLFERVALLGFIPFRRRRKCFRILVYDIEGDSFYSQLDYQQVLFLVSMTGTMIVYHEAFHAGMQEFRRDTQLDANHFRKISNAEVLDVQTPASTA